MDDVNLWVYAKINYFVDVTDILTTHSNYNHPCAFDQKAAIVRNKDCLIYQIIKMTSLYDINIAGFL